MLSMFLSVPPFLHLESAFLSRLLPLSCPIGRRGEGGGKVVGKEGTIREKKSKKRKTGKDLLSA
jgi:hypothetical protein